MFLSTKKLENISKKSAKGNFKKFINIIDTKNNFLTEKIFTTSNNLNIFEDKLKRKQLLTFDNQYKELSGDKYVQFINLKHTAFKSLSKNIFYVAFFY